MIFTIATVENVQYGAIVKIIGRRLAKYERPLSSCKDGNASLSTFPATG